MIFPIVYINKNMTESTFNLAIVIRFIKFFMCFAIDFITAFNQLNNSFHVLVIPLSSKKIFAKIKKKSKVTALALII